MKYIYPSLGNIDFGFIKLNGPGLANQMIVAARAYCLHKKHNIPMLNPTWGKLSIGPYLRHEKDKRHYFGLFDSYGVTGLRKLWAIHHVTHEENCLHDFINSKGDAVIKVAGLGNYFQDLDQKLCHDYFWQIASTKVKEAVERNDFSHTVAMHVRLGDYDQQQRTQLQWYVNVGETIHKHIPSLRILVFSDGRDEELSPLLSLPYVRRASENNNALTDILSISKCKLVVASHSTFSAMGAFIGKCPVIFPKRDFPPLYEDTDRELVITNVSKNAAQQLYCMLNI